MNKSVIFPIIGIVIIVAFIQFMTGISPLDANGPSSSKEKDISADLLADLLEKLSSIVPDKLTVHSVEVTPPLDGVLCGSIIQIEGLSLSANKIIIRR